MRYLLLLFISIFSVISMSAQVTIGLLEDPEKGALLQLKDMEVDSDNATAEKGGLLMPRTKLESKTTLMPFIPNDANFKANVDNVKDRHIGLVVYNVIATADGLEAGIVVWNGTEWESVRNDGKESFFYMPSFNLPITTSGTNYFPIYDEYADQFTAAGLHVYTPDEIEFRVTHYDSSIIDNISFPVDDVVPDNEYMKYDVLKTTAPEGAYINIIIVVK